jgi:hypothetical protein
MFVLISPLGLVDTYVLRDFLRNLVLTSYGHFPSLEDKFNFHFCQLLLFPKSCKGVISCQKDQRVRNKRIPLYGS